MHFWKRKKDTLSSHRKSHSRNTLAFWPDDIAGWLRIPSMITWIVGILGVVKYSNQSISVLLKSFNLPPVTFCWVMLGIGGTVYLLSLSYRFFVEDAARICRPAGKAEAADSIRWRSL